MEIIDNGYFSSNGTIWSTCSNDNSIWLFYLEAKQVHTGNSNERVRPRLQTIGRYYSKTNRSTKEGTDGTAKA